MLSSTGLRTRTLLASGTLALAVAAVIGLLLFTVGNLRDTSDRARHSEVVIAQATTLEKLLLDMETSVRGFVIAGEDSFLEPYNSARAQMPAVQARLERLVRDNSMQEQRARGIGAAIKAWESAYAAPLVATTRAGAARARAVVRTGAGKRQVDAIRQRFDQFTASETALAASRRDTAGSAATRADVAGIAGLLVLIALVGFLTRFLFRAYSREEQAADRAYVATNRVAVLARASEELAESLDYEQTLAEVARIAVPTVADWCTVDLADPDGTIRNVAVAHFDPEKVALARELQARFPVDPDAPSGAPNVIRTGRAELYEDIPDELLDALVDDPEQVRIIRELGLCSVMTVPLTARGRTLGALTLISAESGRRYDADDLPFAEDLGRRIGVAIDNTLLFEQEKRIAETLQRSLLPETLPELDRTAVGARYVPAEDEAEVGGDWYDAIPLPAGQVGLVIGDVVGHGVKAAAVMGQLRSAVRAYTLEGHPPAETIGRVKSMLQASGQAGMVGTLLVMTYDPAQKSLAYSSAGHPPPLLRDASGAVRFLEGALAAPLGVDRRAAPEATATLDAGTTVLLYTDGLVERRGETLTDGLVRLERAVATCHGPVEELLDHVLRELEASTPRADDIALLALAALHTRAGDPLSLDLPAERGSVTLARRAVSAWLEDLGTSREERYELTVALSDACANAIEHAYGPEDATFAVTVEAADGEVLIAVSDSGEWRPQRGTNRGRGIMLMDAYTDALDIERGERGTTVLMRRRLATLAPA